MAEPVQFHRGNRAEYLARFALGTVGYVAPVPREADRFGVDLFLHLGKLEKAGMKVTGPTLAYQVKSSKSDIKLEDGKGLRSFFDDLLPFYIAHVDARDDKLEIYNTHNRIGHGYYPLVKKLTLKLKREPPRCKQNDPSKSSHRYHLGEPIASLKISALDGDDWERYAASLHEVLLSWCQLDLSNLAFKLMGVSIIAHPPVYYEINKPLDLDRVFYGSIRHPELRKRAAVFLNRIAHSLANYFEPANGDNNLKAIIEACGACKCATNSWLSPSA